jgi:hypothetical protein
MNKILLFLFSILVVVLKVVVNRYQVQDHVLKIFVQHHLLNAQEQMVIACIMQINLVIG